ncbi:hypothetical protein G9U51_01960 [Calidifontibacter sp. DB0510]|uniref:Uncharacterized protein n=1 Tax=Metallococcus carri TaxID=1656884 RepID=A0A967E964_9MICO|nr:hypothetical protein [Metallococcus carri]NHN54544.1 hypothetical protein [Metallococcus carri]NOP36617.1 hypothetical protein [Calidifontibacter sp. DB2511S]
MRWEELFGDLEGQLAEAERRDWEAQLPDRTRAERAEVTLLDRCAATIGAVVTIDTAAGPVRGELADLGKDWLCVREEGRSDAWVPQTAALAVAGLSPRSDPAVRIGRRFGMGVALRAIARDRAPVTIHAPGGLRWAGTIDHVGRDHLDLAEHPADAVRRRGAVTGHRAVPFAAICVVRRAVTG